MAITLRRSLAIGVGAFWFKTSFPFFFFLFSPHSFQNTHKTPVWVMQSQIHQHFIEENQGLVLVQQQKMFLLMNLNLFLLLLVL